MKSSKRNNITPAADLLIPSGVILKDNLLTFFILVVIPMLLLAVGSRSNAESLSQMFTPVGIIGLILSFVLLSPATYAYNKASRGEEIKLKDALVNGLKYFIPLTALSLVVGAVILIGFLLLIVPGLIMTRRYYLSAYYLIDQNLSIKEAMQESANASKQNPMAIYGLVAISGAFIAVQIAPGFGLIAGSLLQFLYSVAPALRYQEMKKIYSDTN